MLHATNWGCRWLMWPGLVNCMCGLFDGTNVTTFQSGLITKELICMDWHRLTWHETSCHWANHQPKCLQKRVPKYQLIRYFSTVNEDSLALYSLATRFTANWH